MVENRKGIATTRLQLGTTENFAGKSFESRDDYKMAPVSTLLHCALLIQCLWGASWGAKKPSGGTKATSVVTLDIEHSFDSVHFTKRYPLQGGSPLLCRTP